MKINFSKVKDIKITAWFDGACHNLKDKDSEMGVGVIIRVNGELEVMRDISPNILGTSNIAEYLGLLETLTEIKKIIDGRGSASTYDIIVHSDSMLIVNHFNGLWSCKHPRLRHYLKRCLKIREDIKCKSFILKWVSREYNKDADAMSKLGLINRKNILK